MNLIQSTFGDTQHGNFELVAREGANLVHYYHDNTKPAGPWTKGRTISSAATGEGWLIQSTFGQPPKPNFEVVVPEGGNLIHYYRDNANPAGPWTKGRLVTDGVTGPASFIQSTFGGAHGNFELVVLQGNKLVHYYRDNANPTGPWTRGKDVTDKATGPGTIIQSDFGGAIQGNFEVVVQEGSNLVHYYRDNRNPTGPWYRATVITNKASGGASFLQGEFGKRPGGNFELVALEGSSLVHYYRDNTKASSPWVRGQVITNAASGQGAIIQSDFGGSIGNFEVVVPEGASLVHYYHENMNPASAWKRGRAING